MFFIRSVSMLGSNLTPRVLFAERI
ncbi:hypothetical protein LINPERHAP1_LOCUS16444 [Linum perenne]